MPDVPDTPPAESNQPPTYTEPDEASHARASTPLSTPEPSALHAAPSHLAMPDVPDTPLAESNQPPTYSEPDEASHATAYTSPSTPEPNAAVHASASCSIAPPAPATASREPLETIRTFALAGRTTSAPMPSSAKLSSPAYAPLAPRPEPSVSATDTDAPPASVPRAGEADSHASEAAATHSTSLAASLVSVTVVVVVVLYAIVSDTLPGDTLRGGDTVSCSGSRMASPPLEPTTSTAECAPCASPDAFIRTVTLALSPAARLFPAFAPTTLAHASLVAANQSRVAAPSYKVRGTGRTEGSARYGARNNCGSLAPPTSAVAHARAAGPRAF